MNNPSLSPKTIAAIIIPAFVLIVGIASFQSYRTTYTSGPAAAPSGAEKFARFEKEMPQFERTLVKGYLHSGGPTVRGVVNPVWYRLSTAEKRTAIQAIQQRWAAINSPGDPRGSGASLGASDGSNLAHARYNARGQWEIVVN